MRRVIAALAGVILAVVGALLVINYANNADERAAADLETGPVVVALEEIPVGTPVTEFGDRVEVRQIPRSAVVEGAVRDLQDVQNLVITTATVPGEQLTRSRLVTPEELRARGETELPEELTDHHQVTLLLNKANALGGNIAPGDTVGVFMSFEIDTEADGGADDGTANEEATDEAGRPLVAGGNQVNVTDLTLHKIPVVRVEGAFVADPVTAGDAGNSEQGAEDQVFVTLALEPEPAARLVFAAEWGSVYLSYEPEGAPEDEVPSIVVTLPERGEDVLQ
ncbi:Flp pilus assembly protein CpaB [Ornithinimicrobium kibberense]|uniref:Flp pilus assembly protein CpaB n=1 Tax=Ornithinimicrobium kibberense TaxID=282060 RepID=A0ABV5V323_9MICO|nr:Flp pilus assembly protein CpaB [Ornithinimicrobium kibberense]